jgi:PAS domain S-box-containing protein
MRTFENNAMARVQQDLLLLLTDAMSSDQLLPNLLPMMGSHLGFDAGTLWTVVEDRMVSTETWRALGSSSALRRAEPHGAWYENHRTEVEGIWRIGRASWSEDLPPDATLLRGDPLADGLVSGLWLPIRWSDQCMGVLELVRDEPCARDQDVLETLGTLGLAVGRYLALETSLSERARDLERERTSRKQSEAALRSIHGTLTHLKNSGVIGLAVSRGDGIVLDGNDAFLAMCGVSRAQLEAGLVWWDRRTPPEWRAADEQATAELMATGVAHAFEKEFIRNDGSRVSVLVGAALLDEETADGPWRAICYMVDITARTLVEDELARAHAGLELNVVERTAELDESRRSLADSEGQLRALARRLLGLREENGAQLAREIHDVLGQELTGLKMDAAWLIRRVEERDQAAVEPVLARLRTMVGAVDHVIGTVRRIATDLRPSVLDDLGLVAAIEWYGLDFGRRSGLEIVLELPDELKLERELATALFRIVQELFTNVVRHAQAKTIALALRQDGDVLELRVRDDGMGIASTAGMRLESIGLAGIRERALAFQGTFAIGACAGGAGGTEAVITIPDVAHGVT